MNGWNVALSAFFLGGLNLEAWIRTQLAQPSTWRGLFLLLAAAFGITLSAELQTALPELAIALLGAWEALRKGRAFGEPGA